MYIRTHQTIDLHLNTCSNLKVIIFGEVFKRKADSTKNRQSIKYSRTLVKIQMKPFDELTLFVMQ